MSTLSRIPDDGNAKRNESLKCSRRQSSHMRCLKRYTQEDIEESEVSCQAAMSCPKMGLLALMHFSNNSGQLVYAYEKIWRNLVSEFEYKSNLYFKENINKPWHLIGAQLKVSIVATQSKNWVANGSHYTVERYRKENYLELLLRPILQSS